MSQKLIFLNLLIDSLWSDESFLEKVFDVKSPSTQKLARVNESLGKYFAEDNDCVVCASSNSMEIEELQRNHLKLKSVKWIPANSELSMTDNFAIELVNQSHNENFSSILVAGVSRLELSLSKKLNVPLVSTTTDIELLKKLNSKDYLLSLASKLGLKIPKSDVVKGTQITPSNHLYKSLVSSGGSGVYEYGDLDRIKIWAQRRKLESDWNASKWLRQESLEREMDINCFGFTESTEQKMVSVKYDKSRLSYQHDFNFEIDKKTEADLGNAFNAVRTHLIETGYVGPFGFDSIISKNGDVFPVVDLNVRMNKSHALYQIMNRFYTKRKYTSFFRLRFINNEWPKFSEFWNFFLNQIKIEEFNGSSIFPIDASFWNEGKSECLLALTTDNRSELVLVENWITRFLLGHKGQSRD